MAYSLEVVRRARARLAQAKEDRESENRQHLTEAYVKVPRIKEIDMQLRRTMAQAAQAAFLQGSDGRDLMDRIREENRGLQLERARLAAEFFEEGFLDDGPICPKCGGSGYLGSNMCECRNELCRQEQKKELSLLSGSQGSFQQFRLDYYPDRVDPKYGLSPRTIMEQNLQTCRRYALHFSEKSGNLLFSGDTGLGKTFLSACIARTAADRGYRVVYELMECDLLILDDLGTEMPGQFTTAALYSLLNDRILEGKPMIISTNLTVEDMSRRYSPQIASRLRGNFQRVAFVGEDIRVLKNRGY